MVDSQFRLTVSFVMIALFSIAIIGFSIGFTTDNDAVVSIADDSELSALNSNTRANLSTFKDGGESTYESILETTVEPGSDVSQSTAPFAITAGNLLGTMTNIVYLPYKKIFGSGSGFGIFFTTFVGFMVLLFGIILYKTLRGSP